MESKTAPASSPLIKSKLDKAQKDKDKIKIELADLYKELQERAQRCVTNLEYGIEPTGVLSIATDIERKKEVFKQATDYVNLLSSLDEEINQ